MPYWQLFYHIIWATKQREPIITPDIEKVVYGLLYRKAVGLEATVFALNGVADHIHMVAAVPPKIAVATFIGQVKGVVSARFNKEGGDHVSLYWQDEYGVFSFDGKRLPNYVAYVEKQKEHHVNQTTIAILERAQGGALNLTRELSNSYAINDDEWRRELESSDEDT